jgi:DNA polymerase-1
LQNTYIETLPLLVNKKTGRVQTSFNQGITATGRLSSTEPNLQNIPIRTELGKQIRQAFIAPSGYKLLSLDYSQIELRLAAHFSKDPKMIKAFKQGADIHRATAAEINQVPLEKVSPEMRRQAKAINFGILYGQGPHGLSQQADIPYMRAKEFIDTYFSVYKNIKKWIDRTIISAHEKEYVETLFGRRRYLPEINSSTMMVAKAAERTAVNTPLQGTAADMIKVAMNKTHEFIHHEMLLNDIKMILQVHDELLFEIKDRDVLPVISAVRKIMENVIKLEVPVIVDAKVGKNWAEMEEVKN